MPEPLVAEQGDVEALVGVLKDLRGFAETVRPDSTPAQVTAAKDSANRGLLLLDRLTAALERAERERDGNARGREGWQRTAEGWRLDFHREKARAEKAERALAEIEISEPDWAKGVDENCETLRSIARAALRRSEKASDES